MISKSLTDHFWGKVLNTFFILTLNAYLNPHYQPVSTSNITVCSTCSL